MLGPPQRQLFLSAETAWRLKLELGRESVHNGTDLHLFNDYSHATVATQFEAWSIRTLGDKKFVDVVQRRIKEMKISLGLSQQF
jgi:hypothetical protein